MYQSNQILSGNFVFYLIAILLVMFSQALISKSYQKYKNIKASCGLSGEAVARIILDANNLQDIRIEKATGGVLSDHYDPIKRVIRLSSDIYSGSSIASVSIAAHEVGHAIQHKEKYGFISIRNQLLPLANISSSISWVAIFVGLLLFSTTPLVFYIGIVLLLVIALFQLVTLPVELNASSRALKQLNVHGLLLEEETYGSKSILKAAAFTYIASLIATLLQVLRFVMIANNRRN